MASTAYPTRSYTKTPAATGRELHMLNRFGWGFTPTDLRSLREVGGERAWFEQQLTPDAVTENPKVAELDGFYPKLLGHTPAQKKANDRNNTYQMWEYGRDLSNYSMLRRVYSRRAVLESMVDFWSNHLHASAKHTLGFAQRLSYDQTVRQHALGTFEELLRACTLHPSMLLYLDNWRSRYGNPNENHGRELLELHTVGREAGYTESAVKASAKILSGWTVDESDLTAYYDRDNHTTGAVTVLGFSDANSTRDGRELVDRYLSYLARHPMTAQRVCRKLAQRFVMDDPPQSLVDRLAAAYLDSGTDITTVLRTLVDDEVFWSSAGQKARTPIDDMIATYRALDIDVLSPVSKKSGANAMGHQLGSPYVYHWVTPDGPPEEALPWASPTRMLNSFRYHWALAGGYYPKERVAYRPRRSFLPQRRMRFDLFVDHLSRTVLGRPSSSRLLQACCQGTGVNPGETITARHAVVRYKFPRVMAVLLDSPEHMTR